MFNLIVALTTGGVLIVLLLALAGMICSSLDRRPHRTGAARPDLASTWCDDPRLAYESTHPGWPRIVGDIVDPLPAPTSPPARGEVIDVTPIAQTLTSSPRTAVPLLAAGAHSLTRR